MTNANFLSTILKVMHAFPYHAVVQASCTMTAANLCIGNNFNLNTLLRDGFVSLMLNALRLNHLSWEVKSASAQAVCLLRALDPTFLQRIIKQETDGAVLLERALSGFETSLARRALEELNIQLHPRIFRASQA